MGSHEDLVLSLLFILLNSLFLLPRAAVYKSCSIEAIYQFGASKSDTGNFIREGPIGASSPIARLPYGETYFNRPTGRSSDGLLIIDFLAFALELPLLNPYLDKNAKFDHGVNFAVAGATVLNTFTLAAKNIRAMNTNSSLNVQLNWFKTYLNSICQNSRECGRKLENALFLMGEIGGNDYNYAFFQGKTIEEVRTYVPLVVQTIKDAVRKVVDLGAVRVAVPGNYPIGCSPSYLTAFQSNNPTSYDEINCLKGFNDFAMFHNDQLQQVIEDLRQEYPDVIILYADYYTTLRRVIQSATYLGFEKGTVLKACCGIGGDYNFNLTRMCGADQGVPVCPNPGREVHWDGIHLTQKANKYVAQSFIRDLLPKIRCT